MAHAAAPWISPRIEREFSQEPRWDTGMTLAFLLSGSLEFQVGAQSYHLRPRDILFFRPYEVFCAARREQQYAALVITIRQQMVYQMYPEFDRLRFQVHLLHCREDDPAYHAVCGDIAQIALAMSKPGALGRMRMFSHGSDLLARLIETYGVQTTGEVSDAAGHTTRRMADILRYIHENYTDRVTLPGIAAHVGLQPQYFSTFFKKQFGTNFSEYLSAYRAAQSLHAVTDTDDGILDIAIANGFNNYKSYSAAFRKAYGMLPGEYRKKYRQELEQERPLEEHENELFQVFYPYWSEGSAQELGIRQVQALDLRRENWKPFVNDMINIVSVGRALDCLRSDVQQQLRQAKADLSLDYVRIRDIFSDSLSVYYEDVKKQTVLNWRGLDSVFDFLLSVGLRPFVEIGYMPADLASKKQYAGWQFHPNVSSPKSYAAWADLVRQFISHLIGRYGAEEVRQWYFELWTNPNLKLENSYWYDTQEAFFHFYQVTYEAMRQLDPKVQMGTPNFSYPSGMSWYESFFRFAKENRLYPDFISIHAYSISDSQEEVKQSRGSGRRRHNLYLPAKPELGSPLKQAAAVRECAAPYGFGGLPIIIGDFNVSFMPQDFSRDTCFMAPYLLHCFSLALGQVKGLSYWALSDVHGEFFYSDTLFHGGPGLMDYHGVPKASYLAMGFMNRLSREILKVGDNYILARQGEGFQLLLFNLAFYDQSYRVPSAVPIPNTQRYSVFESANTLDFHVILETKAEEYTITQQKIGRESGSSFDIWLKMGQPTDLNDGLLFQYLQDRSIPDVYIERASGPELRFHTQLEPHGAALISILPTN